MRAPSLIRNVVLAAVVAAPVFAAPVQGLAASAGSLDPAFGDGGRVDRDFGDDLAEQGVAFAIQADGKLLVAGQQTGGGPGRFAVARYLANGDFDQGFGDHGHVLVDAGPSADATGVAVTPGGKIVLGGNAGDGDFAVVRLRPNGDPDTGFNHTGVMTFGFGSGSADEAFAVAVQADGKIVIAGSADRNGTSEFAVARVRQDGSLDPGFSGDGKVKTAFGSSVDQRAEGLAVLHDGRVAAFGESHQGGGRGSDFSLAVYRANGTLDPQFSGDGRVITDFGGGEFGYKVAEDADGKIVVSGETDTADSTCDWALARYKPGGKLDPSFGGDGRVVTSFGTHCDIASGLMLQRDGKVVGVGSASDADSFDAAVVRYLPNGHLDHSFSGDGKVVTPFDDGNSEFWGGAETRSGKIVAGGRVLRLSGESTNFALARYLG
jgi:uncharacterized delta-60 repeat protein